MPSGAPPFCRCCYGTGAVGPLGWPGCHALLPVAARRGGGWVQAASNTALPPGRPENRATGGGKGYEGEGGGCHLGHWPETGGRSCWRKHSGRPERPTGGLWRRWAAWRACEAEGGVLWALYDDLRPALVFRRGSGVEWEPMDGGTVPGEDGVESLGFGVAGDLGCDGAAVLVVQHFGSEAVVCRR